MSGQRSACSNESNVTSAPKKYRPSWWVALVTLLLVFATNVPTAKAQTYLQSAGSPSFSTRIPVQSGYVDAANGRLHLEIPMGSYPQRGGHPYNVSFNYDSNIWASTSMSWQPTNVGGWGWRLVTAGSGGVSRTFTEVGYCNGVLDRTDVYSNWVYAGPDGTTHSFPTVETDEPGDTCSSTDTPNSQGWASDGSGFWLAVTNYLHYSVYAPDGTLVKNATSNHGPEDSNGNYVDEYAPAYDPPNSVLGDTLGRPPYTETVVNGTTTTYTMSNAQGNSTRVYTMTTATIGAKTNFGQSGVTECTTGFCATLTVVRSVQLPDGTKYSFQYDCDSSVDSTDCSSPTGQSAYYGLVTRMTLPTGGTIKYSWQPFTDSQSNHYEWINTLVTPDSSTGWTFTPAVVTTCASGQINCQETFKVIKPSGDEVLYTNTLNGGAWASEVDVYNGTTTLLSKVTQCWEYVAPITNGTCTISGPSTGTPATQIQKMVNSTTMFTPGGSVSETTQYTYDSYGNTTAIEENNYYTGTLPSGPDRTTTIAYLNTTPYINALILNRPTSVVVTNSSGTTVAKTLYSYDSSALVSGAVGSCPAVTGSANHDGTAYGTTNTVRGNVTQIQRLVSGTSNYLTTSMTYDITGQLRTSSDNLGHTTTYCDQDNFFTDPGDSSGQAPSQLIPSHTFNAYLTKITYPTVNSVTLTSSLGYYWGSGDVATSTDANSNPTYNHLFNALNIPSSTSFPNGGWTYNIYDVSNGKETGIDSYIGINHSTALTSTCPAQATPACRHDQLVFDTAGLGRIAGRILVSDPDGQTEMDTAYESNGRVGSGSIPYRGTPPCSQCLESPSYDGLDRVTQTTHADNNSTTTYYGANVSTAGGNSSQLCSSSTYGLGYPILVADEAGNKRQTWTDGFGRAIETDEPGSSSNLTVGTCYSYDLNNNLTQVTSLGLTQTQKPTYTYDMISRLTSKTLPEAGTTCLYYTTTGGTCGSPVSGTLCSGNPSLVCRRVRPSPNQTSSTVYVTTTYTYDALNRLTSISYSDAYGSNPPNPTVKYGYDNVALTGCTTAPPSLTILNGLGRRTSMCDGSGATSWSFDKVGNISTEERTIDGQTPKTLNYSYYIDNSINTIQYPGGRIVTYTEGDAQRMTQVTDTVDSINYVTAPSSPPMYSPAGAVANAIHGFVSGGFGGITESYTYNNRLEVTSIQATSSAGTPLNLSYSYVSGNNGNVSQQTNNASSGRTQTYTYDSLNRLLTAQAQATSGGDCWGQSFGNNGPPVTLAADALANLFYTTSIKCSSPSPQYSMNTSNDNQFTGTGISYDAEGDMTADTAFGYTYNAENRIIVVSGMSGGPYCYTYDGNGLRVMKATPKSGQTCSSTGSNAPNPVMLYWRSVSGQTLAETDGTGSTANANYNEYIFLANRRVAQSNPSSDGVYYYFVDHLGSTRVVTTATGTACYEVDYFPYGAENTPSGFTDTCSTRYRFTGYERDLETTYGTSAGNDYAFARYYNSRLGRFMSADPLDGDITDPQTLNHYAYVRNNPLNLIDPSGMDPEGPIDSGLDWLFGCGWMALLGNVDCGGGFSAPSGHSVAPPQKPSQVKPPKPKPNPNCPQPGINPFNTMGGGAGGEGGAGLGKGRVLALSGNVLSSNQTPIAVQGTVAPVQTATGPPNIIGAYVGGGGQITLSNGEPGQLSGPFNVFVVAAGIGPVNFSVEMACGNHVCQFVVGVPGASDGLGAMIGAYKSKSGVLTTGCKSGGSGGTANANGQG
jgi:RHS repeat-associated protein